MDLENLTGEELQTLGMLSCSLNFIQKICWTHGFCIYLDTALANSIGAPSENNNDNNNDNNDEENTQTPSPTTADESPNPESTNDAGKPTIDTSGGSATAGGDIVNPEEDPNSPTDSIDINEVINMDFVYAIHTFLATQEGQVNVIRNNPLIMLDDSNAYWWLVRNAKTEEVKPLILFQWYQWY